MGAPRGEVLVVGSGVSGLSCGVLLCEAGFGVTVRARERVGDTVSSVAGAVWFPYRAAPRERVIRWATRSLARYRELAEDPQTGVAFRDGVQVGAPEDEPLWRALEGADARPARPEELPAGHDSGIAFRVPVIDTSRYMPWLERGFLALGGRVQAGAVCSLEEALAEHDLVVNATGLGARELADDAELFPIRGQVARVPRGDVERVAFDEGGEVEIAYVIPRTDDCVLGGVAEVGAESLEPDEETTRGILERCARIEPRVAGARVLEVKVGLRPGRSAVRLEAEERRPGKLVVHDYGHGGAGVTLSWGCAEEVRELVERFLGRRAGA